ncbi:MAG: AraC family transcriptional regulator [Pseudomonadota bacterium]|nr:AraC family transcriptional regulator [Pseudomonadota bacterium]
MLNTLQFSLPEILSLIGLSQCVYILVYMAFRSGSLKRALIPAFYFLFLGLGFFADFGHSFIGQTSPYYAVAQWFFWFIGPPLSVLLMVQIARIEKLPNAGLFGVLLLTPLAYLFSVAMASRDSECVIPAGCPIFMDWLLICGLVSGSISMLAIWLQRGVLEDLNREKRGKERYWLILTLVFANLFFLCLMFMGLEYGFTDQKVVLARTLSGLAFVYLANTSLFRIYPQAMQLINTNTKDELSADEKTIAYRIEQLVDMDKIYHEASYGRADLARELEIPETVASKIINVHFRKSFPQLLNERRVADAKQLLAETDASMKVVAEEVGFNSLATFNRVFKDMEGVAPSAYRKAAKSP